MGYPIHQTAPAPAPANEANNIPAPGLLADAASRVDVNAAFNALAAVINDLRQALLDSQHLR